MYVEPKPAAARDAAAPDGADERPGVIDRAEEAIETGLFGSRWLLVPFYVGLAVALLAMMFKFMQAMGHLVWVTLHSDFSAVTIAVLELLDIVLLANLVLIVVFAGYESFVSKMEVAQESRDRPDWMGKVDFSSLKMKVIGSIVAISAIGLLQDFMAEGPKLPDNRQMIWRVVIHGAFLLSGVMFATMDLISEKRRILELQADGHAPITE